MKQTKHISIIGGGLGGLVCALVLAKEGYKVSVFEKQKQCGGNLQTFRKQGHYFDTGMHYAGSLDEGQSLNRYFSYLGIMPELKLKRMDESGFDIIRIKNQEYPFAISLKLFVERLLEIFPNEKAGLTQYAEWLQRCWDGFGMLSFKENTQDWFSNSLSIRELLNSMTQNKSLQQVLAGNHFLYAGHPETTPAYIHGIIQFSFIQSAYKFADGSQQLTALLLNEILKNGGEIHTQSEVSHFKVEAAKIVSMFLKNGEEISSDAFISAIHPSLTMQMIEPDCIRKNYRERLLEMPNTLSCFSVYLVPQKNTFPYLNHNEYLHQTEDIWKDLAEDGTETPHSCMLYTPYSNAQPEFAESIKILSYMDFKRFTKWENTQTGARGQEYEAYKEKISTYLIQMIGEKYPEILNTNIHSFAASPLTWRDYCGSPQGSLYGIQRNMNNPYQAYVSPRTKLENLYLTGQNIKLHGALGVTLSAFLTAAEFTGLDYLLNKVRNV